MKTVEEYRRERLAQAVTLAGGTLDALAEVSGLSPSYLSQVRNGLIDSKTGNPRNLGKIAARKIEQALHQPTGWMDHGDDDHANDGSHVGRSTTIINRSRLDDISEVELVNAIDVLQRVLRAKRQEKIRSSASEEADVVALTVGKAKKRQGRKQG